MRISRLLAVAAIALAPFAALAQGAVAPFRLPAGSTGPADALTIGGSTLPSVLGAKAPLASPAFTGAVTAPSLSLTGSGLSGAIDGSTVGGTAISAILGSKAPVADPAFSGTVTAPRLSIVGPASTGEVPSLTVGGLALQDAIRAALPLKRFGFVGDGNSHLLSSVAWFNGVDVRGYTLAQWQALVPQVGSLSDEIDGVAMQAVLNAQTTIIGARLDLPPNSLALVSRTLVSPGGLAVRGEFARVKAVGGAPFVLFRHGTQAAPSNGEIDITSVQFDLNGGQLIDGFLSPFPGALFGKTVNIEGMTVFNAGPNPVKITNAVRSINIRKNTFFAQSSYQTGPAVLLVSKSYDANTVGSSNRTRGGVFSMVVEENQSTRFEWLAGFEMLADVSPSAGNAMGGIMEGGIVQKNRAYDGRGLAYVKNTFNGSGQINYQAPFWTFRDNDYQGFGAFLSLSGVAHVLVERNLMALDQSNPNATGDPVALIDLMYCENVDVRLNHFGVLPQANKSGIIQGIQTDSYTSNVLAADNVLSEDKQMDAFVHWGAVADAAKAYTNIERGTKRFRPNNLATFARDDGNNQISEGRVLALNGSLAADGKKTRYFFDFIAAHDGTVNGGAGYVTAPIPAGLFRSKPKIISASNVEFDASQLIGGAVESRLTTTSFSYRVVVDSARGNTVRLSVVLEGY